MFIELLLLCVESEKSSALKRILLWIQDIVRSNNVFENLVTYKWNLEEKEKEEGFIWNNRALIRASEKNDLHMVSHFMSINFGRGKGVDIVFQINDSKFRQEISRGRFEIAWFEDQTEECNEVLRHYRNFEAACSPAFLISRLRQSLRERGGRTPTLQDPISKALECVHICQMQERIYIEYLGHFRKVQQSLEQFLGKKETHYSWW